MKVSGFSLLVLGIVILVQAGISSRHQGTIVDVGPIHATATEPKDVPVSPAAGGIAVIAGILLLAIPRKRFADAA